MEEDDVSKDSSGTGRHEPEGRVKLGDQLTVILKVRTALEQLRRGEEPPDVRGKPSLSGLVVEPEGLAQVVGDDELQVEWSVPGQKQLLDFPSHLEKLTEKKTNEKLPQLPLEFHVLTNNWALLYSF